MDSTKIFQFVILVVVVGFLATVAVRFAEIDVYQLTGLSVFGPSVDIEPSKDPVVNSNFSLPPERKVVCEKRTPQNASSLGTLVTQSFQNGQWTPEDISCEWRCNAGFQKIGAVCVDIDECSVQSDACGTGETCKNLTGGFICRNASLLPSPYVAIFDSYPKANDSKSTLYDFLNEGSIDIADQFLRDQFVIPRYKPVEFKPPLSWTEDPYDEKYWQFMFYSLRETRHLVFAGKVTEDPKYYQKLSEIIEGFIDTGRDENKPYSWDLHGAAFRTMVLVNSWWKLREAGLLPEPLSTKMLKAIEVHGEFLEKEENFQGEHNHGINQAAGLLLIAENFPDLPKSAEWKALAISRLNDSIENNVDADGVLNENSPYYHFYSMALYWEIFKYAKENKIELGDHFEDKLKGMIGYAAFILQPDLSTPTLGASLETQVNYAQEFREMTEINSYLKYVLTRGAEGTKPPKTSVYLPHAGQTIFRSDWEAGEEFKKASQAIFDFGAYRTKHSDLDALSFTLYGSGGVLMPDSGLFTYESNEERDYFHGTSAHNTVVVDGKDQNEGAAISGNFISGNGFAYQSGFHQLYPEVTHVRGFLLYGSEYVVIIDRLISDSNHSFEQAFHFFPEAQLISDGNILRGVDLDSDRAVALIQVHPSPASTSFYKGETTPFRGWCSKQYEIAVPCEYVGFTKTGSSAEFITLIKIGDKDPDISVTLLEDSGDRIRFRVRDSDRVIEFGFEHLMRPEEMVFVNELNGGVGS